MYSNGFTKFRKATQEEIELLNPRKFLFRTTDGQNIYVGDSFHSVNENFVIEHFEDVSEGFVYQNNYKYYTSRRKAEDYVVRNKPCLSLKDIATVYVTANNFDLDNPNKHSHAQNQSRNIYELAKKKSNL